MATKFYYIDDDPMETIEETAKGLSSSSPEIDIISYQHKKWDEQIQFIIDNQDNIDGLLFDWGLANANADGEKANFNVEALAQQIRRLTIDGNELKKDFPLVLCSAQTKFTEVFSKELTGHDLFDAIYNKECFDDEAEKITNELVNLANGYKKITEGNSARELLGISEEDEIDNRIEQYLTQIMSKGSPVHEIARFVLKKIVEISGPLIDEFTLSARLGIDLEKAASKKQSLEKLRTILEPYSYKGVFSDAYWQWWSEDISKWMKKTGISNKSPEEKVLLLNDMFEMDLHPAKPTLKSTSNDFWVVCEISKQPLALEDAVIMLKENDDFSHVPWEEEKYLSIDEALVADINRIHPDEKERVQKLKKIHTPKRNRE